MIWEGHYVKGQSWILSSCGRSKAVRSPIKVREETALWVGGGGGGTATPGVILTWPSAVRDQAASPAQNFPQTEAQITNTDVINIGYLHSKLACFGIALQYSAGNRLHFKLESFLDKLDLRSTGSWEPRERSGPALEARRSNPAD